MYASSTDLIVSGFGSATLAVIAILSLVVAMSIAFIVFYFGWGKLARILSDKSLKIGGYYVRNKPYAGYHRFRSEKWNMEHM